MPGEQERGNATITIVTVCRNSAATVAATIQSVLSQKDADVEYIVIDGASTDGTQEIVRSFGDIVDLFLSEPDSGIADAFNKGITRATGSVIGLINSDDRLLPGAIRAVREYFAENPTVDVVHGDVMLFAGERFVKRMKPAGRWWYPWRLVLFNHPATFVRRKLYLAQGLFDINYPIAMDVELFSRWIRNQVVIRYQPLSLVRMQSGGVSGRESYRGYREARTALVANGFSPVVALVQMWSRFIIQFVLESILIVRRGK